MKKGNDLEQRTFNFAVEVINLLKQLKYSKENEVIRCQLAKAATSIGANYEESQGAYSKDDFKYKMGICLREARESNYWMRIIKATGAIKENSKLDLLIQESIELKKIFSSIAKKVNFRKDVV